MKNILTILALWLPAAGDAHPYILVDATVEVLQSGDRIDGLRITWVYDADFTATLLADFGLDADGDGNLTPREQRQIETIVTEWPPAFDGDVYVIDAADPDLVRLPAVRSDHAARVEGGILTEQFTRAVPDDNPLTIAIYDPAYVTAYTISAVQVTGQGSCSAEIIKADLMRARAKLAFLLSDIPEEMVEMAYPAVGRDFADQVKVICG